MNIYAEEFKANHYNEEDKEITFKGNIIYLSRTKAKFLEALLSKNLASFNDLRMGRNTSEAYVRVYVKEFRTILNPIGYDIITRRGLGYKFVKQQQEATNNG